MDQPFRLSLYLRRLARQWKLILIPTVIALLIAILLSFLMPVRYTAATMMIAPKRQIAWRWTNKVHDVIDLRFDWRAEVMPLVETEKVAAYALADVGDQLSHRYTTTELISATSVKPDEEALFTIRVKADDPKDAALLANALARALPKAVADIYGGAQDSFVDAEADVRKSYDEWDEKWRAYRAKYGIGLGFSGDIAANETEVFGNQSAIKQELTVKSSDLASLIVFRDKIAKVQMALANNEENNHLALLDTPELASYGLDFADLQTLTPAQLTEKLSSLQARVQSDVDILNKDLLALQEEVANLLQERSHIMLNRGVWYESVKALESKKVEMNVRRIVEGQRVQQIEAAETPTHPSQPNWLLNLALALITGLLGGLFLAVIVVYLGGEDAL